MLKRHLALTLTTTALLLGASPFSAVLAEDGTPPADAPAPEGAPPAPEGAGPGAGGPPQQGGLMDPKKGGAMFDQADVDKDGALTRDEMLAAHKKRVNEIFDKLDADKSGTVTKDEMNKGREMLREKLRQHFKGRGEGKRGLRDGGMAPDGGEQPE